MKKIVNDVDVTVMLFSEGKGAFVFIGDEFAGALEQDAIGWTGYPVLGETALYSPGDMWGVVRTMVHDYAHQSLREVLAL